MQVDDNLISKLRSFRKEIIEGSSANITMSVFPIPLIHNCKNVSFINKGYYKRHNGELYLCKVEEKNNADFRVLECEICHKEFCLMNTGVQNWDVFPSKCKEKSK